MEKRTRKHKPLKAPRSQRDIAKQLRWMAEHMLDIATSMDYYGGFAEWAKHGSELANASLIVEQWADEIERTQE